MRKTEKARMNGIFTPIFVFVSIMASVIIAQVIDNTLFSGIAVCGTYILIYLLFSDKNEPEKAFDKRTGAVMLLSFLAVNAIVSALLSCFFEPVTRTFTIPEALVSVLLFPIAEELLFRKTFYKSLKENVPKWAALILSSLVFALLHSSVPSMIAAGIAGIMLCFIYDRCPIVIPILCHAANNLLALISHLRG